MWIKESSQGHPHESVVGIIGGSKSNMAAGSHFENYIFHNLAYSGVWFVTYGVFWAEKLMPV